MGNGETKPKEESEHVPTKATHKRPKTNDAQQRTEGTNKVSNKSGMKAKHTSQTNDSQPKGERTRDHSRKSETKAKRPKQTDDAQKSEKAGDISDKNEIKTDEQDHGHSSKTKKTEHTSKKTAAKSESKHEHKNAESKTKAKSDSEVKKSESKRDPEKKKKKKTDVNTEEQKEATKSHSKKEPKKEGTHENERKSKTEKISEEKRKSKAKGEKKSKHSSEKMMEGAENISKVQDTELTTEFDINKKKDDKANKGKKEKKVKRTSETKQVVGNTENEVKDKVLPGEAIQNKKHDESMNKVAEHPVEFVNNVADGNDALQEKANLMQNAVKEAHKESPPGISDGGILHEEVPAKAGLLEDVPHGNIVHEDVQQNIPHDEVLNEKTKNEEKRITSPLDAVSFDGAVNANKDINQSNKVDNHEANPAAITVPVLSPGRNNVQREVDVESEIFRKRNVGNAIYSRIQRLAVIKQASLNYDKHHSTLIFDDEDNYTNSNPLSQTVKLLEKSDSVVGKIRLLMSSSLFEKRPLDAYILKATGAHGTKYISGDDRKFQFVSGVSSPVGIAVVASKIAVLFIDEQHYNHAKKEACKDWSVIECEGDVAVEASKWLVQNLASEAIVGFDPKFLSCYDYDTIHEKLLVKDIDLEPISTNLVDVIWNRPRVENVDVKPLLFIDEKFSGYTIKGNIESIRDIMQNNEIGLYIMTNLDEIAWTFQLRGFDYPYSSVFMSYAIITQNLVELYVDSAKLTEEIKSILTDNDIRLKEYKNAVEGIKHNITNSKNKVLLTVDCSYDIARLVPKSKLVLKSVSPGQTIAAIRSSHDVEILRKAFIDQAMAVCELFYWLENTSDITELSVVQKIEEITSVQENFINFDYHPIVAYGQHTLDPDFIPSDNDNYAINKSDLLVIRIGSCYKGGQASMGRTIHIGEPSPDQKESFTKLLKVFVAFALTKFPSGVTKAELATIENQNLWRFEIESKHELLSRRKYCESVDDNIALFTGEIYKEKAWAGTIISNKPNYFKSNDKYSIQLENILVCKETGTKKGATEQFLTFEDLTLIPLQRKLIDKSLLSEKELGYINTYHCRVKDLVGAELRRLGKQEVLSWLTNETQTI